jgi:replicative DNA helicase
VTHLRRLQRDSLTRLVQQVDALTPGTTPPDTVPTGFPSLDSVLGGGMRHRDLVVLGGDVGAGKSSLALGIALRTASAGYAVAFVSGEMDEDRLMERAIALEARVTIDELRSGKVSDEKRAAMGAAALKFRDLDLSVHPLVGRDFEEALEPAFGSTPALLVIDYAQLLPPPAQRTSQEEDTAAAVRALKMLALDRGLACLAISQLPRHVGTRPDPRPTLDDFGAGGAVKQHADVVMAIYREEMYNPGGGVEGAVELMVHKNRNGPTGFIDLYLYRQWLRFEDMLDPDR